MQQDYTPVKQEPAVEVEPLEFNFSFEQTTTTESTSQPTQKSELSPSQETNELADLEFSFDLAPLHESEENQTIAAPAAQENTNALDFNLELTHENPEVKPNEQTSSLDELQLAEQAPLESNSIAPIEFSLDEPALVTAPEIETQNLVDLVGEETTPDQTKDPLVEAFPELKQLDENELDLKLAEQYIKLERAAQALLQQAMSKNSTQNNNNARKTYLIAIYHKQSEMHCFLVLQKYEKIALFYMGWYNFGCIGEPPMPIMSNSYLNLKIGEPLSLTVMLTALLHPILLIAVHVRHLTGYA